MAKEGAEHKNNIPNFQNNKINNEEVIMDIEINTEEHIINLFNLPPNNNDKLEKFSYKPGSEHKSESSAEITDDHIKPKKNIASIIKDENGSMARNIIDNEELFNNLSNQYKLILAELMSNDKVSGQEYISRILDNTDDELTLSMIKNKVIYKFLNRSNKVKIIEKLLKSPWLHQEETKRIIDFIGKGNSNIFNNISLQNKQNLESLNNTGSDSMYREHSSDPINTSPDKKKRNKYDDFLTEF